jgi:hypothetical protein
MAKRKPRETVQINLRIKEELRRKLEAEATRMGQSMNGVIIDRIELSFRNQQLRDIDQIARDLKVAAEQQHTKNLLGDLVRDVEALTKALASASLDEHAQAALAKAQQTVAVVSYEELRRAHTTGQQVETGDR